MPTFRKSDSAAEGGGLPWSTRFLGVKWYYLASFCLFLAPLLPVWFAVDNLRQFGTQIVVGFGSLAAGAIVGFLFGIPRETTDSDRSKQTTNGGKTGDANDESPLRYEPGPNTNLEQVSDWLVKVLIGASLVQWREIRAQFIAFSSAVAEAIPMAGSRAYVAGYIGYNGILGFIATFLITKLFMPGAMKAVRAQLDLIGKKINATERNVRLGPAYEAFKVPKEDPSYKPGLVAALQLLDKEIGAEPTFAPASLAKGLVLRRLDRLQEAQEAIQACLNARRDAGTKKPSDDADLYYNLACYQNVAAETALASDDSNGFRELRKEAQGSYNEAVKIDPSLKVVAQSDQDLQSLLLESRKAQLDQIAVIAELARSAVTGAAAACNLDVGAANRVVALENALTKLVEVLGKQAAIGAANVAKARVLNNLNRTDEVAAAAQEALAIRLATRMPEVPDVDGELYYILAVANNRLSEAGDEPEKAAVLQEKAWNALKRAIELASQNAQKAQVDPALASLLRNKRGLWQGLTGLALTV